MVYSNVYNYRQQSANLLQPGKCLSWSHLRQSLNPRLQGLLADLARPALSVLLQELLVELLVDKDITAQH